MTKICSFLLFFKKKKVFSILFNIFSYLIDIKKNKVLLKERFTVLLIGQNIASFQTNSSIIDR